MLQARISSGIPFTGTQLLAQVTKSAIGGLGRGELNMMSSHLITEGIKVDTYEPTPLEIGDRVPYKGIR